MIINVLVCKPDGTQVVEEREVADTWFSAVTETEVAANSETAPSTAS